jgi:subtilisin family serine protease
MPPTRTIPLHEASIEQLQVLLGLSFEEANAVVAARPFASVGEMEKFFPARIPREWLRSGIPMLDINSASVARLQQVLGIPAESAQLIVANRPYYFLYELRGLLTNDDAALSRIEDFFAPPTFSYLDKTSGTTVALDPDPSQMLVRLRQEDTETANNVARFAGLKEVTRTRLRERYRIFSVAQVETAADTISRLKKNALVEQVVPSFRDTERNSVYFDPQYCIVQFKPDVASRRAEELIASLDLQIYRRHRTAGLFTLEVDVGKDDPGAMVRALNALNGSLLVQFAEPAYIGLNDLEGQPRSKKRSVEHQARTVDMETAAVPWNLLLVNAPEAWNSDRGTPDVVIAVVDTGVDFEHPALRSSILARPPQESWNFADDVDPSPIDEEGHGTFIAGLLVGNGMLGVNGICPGCRVLPLKVPIDGTTESYARRRDAILYALDYVEPDQRLIINISWKTTGNVGLIHDAIDAAVRRNAVVVCSAGNWPQTANEPHYPSDYLSSVSVGGVDRTRRRAPYSFYGTAVDLAAPGGGGTGVSEEDILSASPGAGVTTDFGTSFAAPHVAGAAALVLSHSPGTSVAEVRRLLESSAVQLVDEGLGNGLLDLSAAIGTLFGIEGPVATEDAAPNAADGLVDDVSDPSAATGNVVWDEEPVVTDHRTDDASDGLVAINTLDVETLVLTFALFRITARLIVQRRPFGQLADIRGILGLTSEQYAYIDQFAA